MTRFHHPVGNIWSNLKDPDLDFLSIEVVAISSIDKSL